MGSNCTLSGSLKEGLANGTYTDFLSVFAQVVTAACFEVIT
jgi:hypothetical protein